MSIKVAVSDVSAVVEDELVDLPALPPLSGSDVEPSLDMPVCGGLFETLSDNYLILLLCSRITVDISYSEGKALYQTVTSMV